MFVCHLVQREVLKKKKAFDEWKRWDVSIDESFYCHASIAASLSGCHRYTGLWDSRCLEYF
jgi:hypothetical protein